MSIFDTNVMKDGVTHLTKVDERLEQIISKVGPLRIKKLQNDDFKALCSIIVSQQLSAKAAITIFERLQNLCDAKNGITPESLERINHQEFKSCGVSSQKIRSIHAVTAISRTNPALFKNISQLPSDEAIDALTAIHGIGPWTANIFLLSQHGRKDIFPTNDNTLRVALKKIYCVDNDHLCRVISPWRPYRSIAARYLWAWADMGPAD